MRKWLLALVTAVLALGLAACGETAEPTKGTSEENQSELTAKEVYTKALEASQEMESAEIQMNLKQKIESEAEQQAMETESSFDMKMTMDPLAIYQKGKTKMTMDGAEGLSEVPVEMYMTQDGIYVYNQQAGKWLKMNNAAMDALNSMAGKKQDPSKQLEMLEDYTEDFLFEQSDDEFILKLNAEGEKFNELIQKTMKESIPAELTDAMGVEGQEFLDNMKINSMAYEMHIDKETFNMNSFNMDMDMTMGVEGDSINIVQNMQAEYTNINKVEPITVPEDVKNNAIEQ